MMVMMMIDDHDGDEATRTCDENTCQSEEKSQRVGSTGGTCVRHSDESADTDYTIREHALVSPEFDGKRLRWYCRQVSVFASIKSKKQCEVMIKAGKIHVNGKEVCDSSRIIRDGDTVSIVESNNKVSRSGEKQTESEATTAGVRGIGVKIVRVLNSGLLIVFKPTGTRTKGSFSPDTLEMIVSSLVNDGRQYTALTKLETGCPGLICCVVSGSRCLVDNPVAVSYRYTTLVFGNVPVHWSRGVYVTMPKNSYRRWKSKKSAAAAAMRVGEEDGDCADEHDTEEELSAGTDFTPFVASEGSSGHLDHYLYIRCVERTESAQMSASTLEIHSAALDGRLCNMICYVLRKLNHGVVNDRFCKREFAELPRAVRNRLKSKICIGCYGLEIKDSAGNEHSTQTAPCNVQVLVPVPDRLKASWWNEFLSDR